MVNRPHQEAPAVFDVAERTASHDWTQRLLTRGGSEAVGICGHVIVEDLRGLRWAMTCSKAKPQLRVLLAGHSSSDLRGAQEYLQSQGSEGDRRL